ncbi:MAG: type II secretion system protein [bacterium]
MITKNKENKSKETGQKRGFTLIEVMVSVSLFAMVMTLSLGAILSIIDGNKKAQAINAVANNLNFAVESMVRDIKTGYAYSCNNTVPADNTSPTITTATNDRCLTGGDINSGNISLVSTITGSNRGVRYYRQIELDGKGRIYKATSVGTAYPVTSPEVDIKELSFYLNNPVSGDGQPKIFLIIKGTANVNPTQTSDFTIQTLISQRNLNLPK